MLRFQAKRSILFLRAFFFLHQRDYLLQVIYDGLKFGDRFAGEVLRFGKFVAVFKGIVLEPGDVELVAALFDVGNVEPAHPAGLAGVSSFAEAVRVFAVGLLEFSEVLRGERTILLGDARHIGASVKNPDFLGGWALLE